jgi:hypothetical protein
MATTIFGGNLPISSSNLSKQFSEIPGYKKDAATLIANRI